MEGEDEDDDTSKKIIVMELSTMQKLHGQLEAAAESVRSMNCRTDSYRWERAAKAIQLVLSCFCPCTSDQNSLQAPALVLNACVLAL